MYINIRIQTLKSTVHLIFVVIVYYGIVLRR